MNSPAPSPARKRSIRSALGRWSLILILVLASAALGWIWLFAEASQRQNQVLITAAVLVLTALALMVWLLFLSPWTWKKRLALAAAIVGALVVVGSLLELRDVSGDLVPILAWRWSREPGEAGSRPASIADQATGRLSSPDDYPQYLGPDRTGEARGARLARDASIARAELLWRQPIGAGWSGFAVAGDFAVTQEQRDAEELVVAYDLTTGQVRWSYAVEARHEDPLGGLGPRATPTVVGERVYAQGATGLLSCLELASGRLIWQRDILTEHGAKRPDYGVSSSPLVVDDKVVVQAGATGGASLVAYDRSTGELIWTGGNDPAAYSSPALATLAGQRQILIFNRVHLSAHDVATGEVLWRHPWPRGSEHTSQPVLLPGDRVFLSSGYGIGSQLLQISRDADRWQVSTLWESLGMKAKFTNVVHREGYLYGLDDGILACLDAATGERCWKRGRFGHGQLILADDLLVVLSEKGIVAVVEARPDEAVELGRFEAIEGKTWNTPALAGNLLLVRNAREAACYRLPARL